MDKRSILFDFVVSDEKKSFVTLAPGVNIIKPFSMSLTAGTNKLERLSVVINI
jgi:hypothetical protein